MSRKFLHEISERSARVSMFLFFSLFFLSTAFFVFADDTASNQNIFQDSDQDGLSNDEEALYKTDPMNKDSDNDGYGDGVEVEGGYDPLKPAPGDRLIENSGEQVPVTDGSGSNLTDALSDEIAGIVQNNAVEGSEVDLESITASVQNILAQTNQEVVLPEVDINGIKIKRLPKNLKGDAKDEKEKEYATEYLTVMAYILANNSPKAIQEEGDLTDMITSMSTDSLSAIALGNTEYLEDLGTRGEKILKETKEIEVPEGMLDVHVKAMKMASYSIQLKDEVKKENGTQDPIGQIASLSKIQGFLEVVTDFGQEVHGKLSDYGITEIPIDL